MYRFYSKDIEKVKRLTTPGYVGSDAVQGYYKKYKNLEKELEDNKEGYSASTAYLSKVRSLKMLPSPLGLIKFEGNEGQIRANNLKLGNNYAVALSSSMRFLSNTQVVDLPGNRLGQKGGAAIIGSLADRVRNINLDNNKIGFDGITNLVKWVDHLNLRCQLEELSLEGNNLGDDLAIDLIASLNRWLPPLRDLNLSRNNISDKGAVVLAEFLAAHYHLKTIKISWNKIKSKGGIAIAESLLDNQRIVFFDASFNQFGVKRNGEFGQKMGEAINKGILRHVDISYNSMDKNECNKLGEVIHDNHTLWGLHMMGNECVLDSMGFIRTDFKNTKESRDILYSPVKEGNTFIQTLTKARNAKIMSYQMCWICEGWSEKKFEWRIGHSGNIIKEPVYIHFDFDEYRPWLLEKDEDHGSFYIWKMIPPGKTHYFYSFGGEKGTPESAKDQHHNKIPTVKHVREVRFVEIDGKTNLKVEFFQSFELRSINYVFGTQSKILDHDYDPIKFQAIVPRLNDKVWVRPVYTRPRTPWTFPISLFKDYQIENEAKLNDCFEFDWNCMKFPKMSEQEQEEVKEQLRKSYKMIKEAYKVLSSIGSNGAVFSILLNCYTDFVKQIGLLDGKVINQTSSDTEFLSINKRSKASNLNPGVALVRFQFMEILMRLAFKRYYDETKEAPTRAEAIRLFYERNLMPTYGHLNPQKWRDERYWNEEVDNIYKAHFPIFDQLYKKFGCHSMKPGEKPFMTVDEFETIFVHSGLVNDNFVGRDCYLSYNIAMMTQVDELNRDKHLKAVFVEFLEAFGRACDKMSLAPYIQENTDDPPMTDQERQEQPLNKKIENVLPYLYENCMLNNFKEKWQWPQREVETGLFKDKYFKKKKKKDSVLDETADLNEDESPNKERGIFEI